MSQELEPVQDAAMIPMPRIVNFVRQITHDVRNGLNAIDLQSAFIGEIAGPGEVAEEISKLRRMVTHVTGDMQQLSSRFSELRPVLMDYPVEEFLQGLKERVDSEFETQAKRIVWEEKVGSEEVEMDYNLLLATVVELVRNAIFFREGDNPIYFTATTDEKQVVFEVRQTRSKPATPFDDWGRQPLQSSRRGGYGLGLFHARRVLVLLRGDLQPGYDEAAGQLTVRLTLPLKPAAST